VADFVGGSPYAAKPTLATLANAMDVGDASNLERLRWLHPDPAAARIHAEWIDDATIRARIAHGEAEYGHVFDPHTACAVEAVERRRRAGDTRAWCAAATAHRAGRCRRTCSPEGRSCRPIRRPHPTHRRCCSSIHAGRHRHRR
jgi:threonine synthase